MYNLVEVMREKRLLTTVQARNLTFMANEELYDIENDSFQMVDTFGNEMYQGIIESSNKV